MDQTEFCKKTNFNRSPYAGLFVDLTCINRTPVYSEL